MLVKNFVEGMTLVAWFFVVVVVFKIFFPKEIDKRFGGPETEGK